MRKASVTSYLLIPYYRTGIHSRLILILLTWTTRTFAYVLLPKVSVLCIRTHFRNFSITSPPRCLHTPHSRTVPWGILLFSLLYTFCSHFGTHLLSRLCTSVLTFVNLVCSAATESPVASSMLAGWNFPLDCARECFIPGCGNHERPRHSMALFHRLVARGHVSHHSSGPNDGIQPVRMSVSDKIK